MNTDTPKITITEEKDPVEIARARASAARFEKNWAWLEANAKEVYSHRGKVICVAGQELFVGDSAAEVLARARTAHPDDDGLFTRYIPESKAPRIYAN
jgi:hypothetical protein